MSPGLLVEADVSLYNCYIPSEDVVAGEIEGELIVVPLAKGIGDVQDELFILNETGKVLWNGLDGKRSLRTLIDELSMEFDVPVDEIEEDVIEFVGELVRRRILVEVS